jgi:hypothetical protein
MKKSNNKFRQRCDEDNYNLIFVTCDSSIFLNKHTFITALYGSEAVNIYKNENGENKSKVTFMDNGIWGKKVYTNIDIILFIESGIDFLRNDFDPYVFLNPHNITKLKRIPEPFYSMKCICPK